MPGQGQADAATGSVAVGAITAASIAASAIGTSEFAAAVDARIADALWDEATAGHLATGTAGEEVWQKAIRTITYTGGAGAGVIGTVTVFTPTGRVELDSYYEFCTTTLVGAATLETGFADDTAALGAQTADATTVVAGEGRSSGGGWPAAGYAVNQVDAVIFARPLLISLPIIQTVGAANITSGVVVAYCRWRPMSAGATLA